MYSLAEDNYMLNFGNKRALAGINIHVRWASMNSKNVNHSGKRRFFIHTQAPDSTCHFQQCDIN